jgi:hypothetical protein
MIGPLRRGFFTRLLVHMGSPLGVTFCYEVASTRFLAAYDEAEGCFQMAANLGHPSAARAIKRWYEIISSST